MRLSRRRDSSAWADLRSRFKATFPAAQHWRGHEIELLFEIEAVLHLYETLVPSATERPAQQAWAFVSGYSIRNLNDTPEQRRMCLLLREHLKYVKTSSAWRWWLKWYTEQPSDIRLYQFSKMPDGNWAFEQRMYDVALRTERLEAYRAHFHSPTQAGNATLRDSRRDGTSAPTAGWTDRTCRSWSGAGASGSR